jgi:hypothetical protein
VSEEGYIEGNRNYRLRSQVRKCRVSRPPLLSHWVVSKKTEESLDSDCRMWYSIHSRVALASAVSVDPHRFPLGHQKDRREFGLRIQREWASLKLKLFERAQGNSELDRIAWRAFILKFLKQIFKFAGCHVISCCTTYVLTVQSRVRRRHNDNNVPQS